MSLLPGAEPISRRAGRAGVLLVHGFGGNPSSMRDLAGLLYSDGCSVEAPLLPGHGTVVEDLIGIGWPQWAEATAEALERLSADSDVQVVFGQSMGAALAIEAALAVPTVVGVVCSNPKIVAEVGEARVTVSEMVAAGELVIPGGRADIADPDVIDSSYRSIALPALLSMWTGLEHLEPHLGETDVPLLVMTSTNDHVVAPEESDVLAARWSGPVERLSLERSFHMATLDLDREELRDHTRRFVRRVCR